MCHSLSNNLNVFIDLLVIVTECVKADQRAQDVVCYCSIDDCNVTKLYCGLLKSLQLTCQDV